MDRDISTKKNEPEFWCGEVKAGIFFLQIMWLTFAKSGLTKALCPGPVVAGAINLIPLLAARLKEIVL